MLRASLPMHESQMTEHRTHFDIFTTVLTIHSVNLWSCLHGAGKELGQVCPWMPTGRLLPTLAKQNPEPGRCELNTLTTTLSCSIRVKFTQWKNTISHQYIPLFCISKCWVSSYLIVLQASLELKVISKTLKLCRVQCYLGYIHVYLRLSQSTYL